MRLYRSLFYVLMVLFVSGVVLIVTADPSRVMSRIAIGMITGSFVGILTTFVNYIHAKQSYFEDLYKNALDLYFDLQYELVNAKLKVEDIETNDKQFLIDTAISPKVNDVEIGNIKDKSYNKYYTKFDSYAYVSLLFGRKVIRILEKLDDFVSIELKYVSSYSCLKDSFVCLQDGHFSCIEEEELCMGDKDSFYDYIVKNMYDWRDYTYYCIRRLWELMVSLENSLKPFSVGQGYKGMPAEMLKSTESVFSDLPKRNPVEERRNGIDSE